MNTWSLLRRSGTEALLRVSYSEPSSPPSARRSAHDLLLHYPHLAPGWRGVFTNKSTWPRGVGRKGLQRNALFHQLLQALIELAAMGSNKRVVLDSEERSILEALSNHAAAHGDVRAPRQRQFQMGGVA